MSLYRKFNAIGLCSNQIDVSQSRINFFHRKRDRGNECRDYKARKIAYVNIKYNQY